MALHLDQKIIPTPAAGETGGMTYQTGQKPLLAAVRPDQPLELSYKDHRFGGRVLGIGDADKGLALVSCFRLIKAVEVHHLAILGVPTVQGLAGRSTG